LSDQKGSSRGHSGCIVVTDKWYAQSMRCFSATWTFIN
jgi:hypothetical protein